MAVFRIEKTRITVMSNYHLRDMSLSLKAKGLLSLMLSLPENWDYTMKGLARICKDGIDSISGGIRELEAHGYLIRSRVRSANGQLGSIEYTILEQPKAPSPTQKKPIRENPVQANPMLDAPIQENPAQLNKEESSNYPSKTDLSITQESSPILSSPPAPRERSGQDGMRKRESYRALILENIEYDVLSQNVQLADYFVPPYSFRYPYYNLNGAFWPHLRILQKKNAMNYLFIAFLTPYSIFSLAVCSCIQ